MLLALQRLGLGKHSYLACLSCNACWKNKRRLQSCKDGDAIERIASQGLLWALITTPARELALQVTDHLRDAARYTSIRVVPIVGGLSMQKQERLLTERPEIIVGTPGRLWELMSGGEHHLVELHSLCWMKQIER
ncbi:DEAD-box ATP-dependent RNA helicase 13 [Ancistrocladus abbreviatus]